MISELKNSLKSLYHRYNANKWSAGEAKREKRTLESYISPLGRLTDDEKHQIREVWGEVVPFNLKRGYSYFEGMKNLRGFDSRYLPHSYYFPYLYRALNEEGVAKILSNKSLTEIIYKGICKFPRTVLKSIGGVLFDGSGKHIEVGMVEALLMMEQEDMLLKPSTDSNQGFGISLISSADRGNMIERLRKGISLMPNNDFVLQAKVAQSPATEVLNPTSLNCMRITTLNLNGEISVCSMAIKCGPKNSPVDNIGTGKRGVIVGINADGYLDDTGFYGNGEKAHEHNGVVFKGKRIPRFEEILRTAVELHRVVERCKIVGWDLALDDKNEPVLIEGNTDIPGISFEQICSGPIFRERTEEVVEYIRQVSRMNNKCNSIQIFRGG